jgi:hypothetical protein
VVGQARQILRCGLYIRKYLFSRMERVLHLQKNTQFQGAQVNKQKNLFFLKPIIS